MLYTFVKKFTIFTIFCKYMQHLPFCVCLPYKFTWQVNQVNCKHINVIFQISISLYITIIKSNGGLLCMKKTTVTENQSIAANPSNSGLPSRSINQTTNPMNRCSVTINSHIFIVKAFVNNQISFKLSGLIVTTITSPDST